jgi:hypothetical protein
LLLGATTEAAIFSHHPQMLRRQGEGPRSTSRSGATKYIGYKAACKFIKASGIFGRNVEQQVG